ncbi:MAG: outer membrane protein assembly factor BamD [Desulfuromonadales bacterium]|nr:outer membrane protein assembly factor BamD [Desulfuromonadales bacterium]
MKIRLTAAFIFIGSALLLQGCAELKLNKPVDELYRDGESSFQKGKYEDALAQWKRVKESFPEPGLSARTEINIADAYFLNKDYIEAAAEYDNFRKLHPSHDLAGYALFGQGLSYFKQIKGIDTDQTPVKNALTIFESYLKLYPGGANTLEVQDKIRACRDKQLQYELYVGGYYLRTKLYPAAIARFEWALYNFVELPRTDETLYNLGKAYIKGGQKTKGRDVYSRLLKEYASSKFAPEVKKVIEQL